MSRVRAVVGTSIMIALTDVEIGDILYHSGTERDPIVSQIDKAIIDGVLKIRFHYVPRKQTPPAWYKPVPWKPINVSQWMDPEDRRFGNGCCFIHDLKLERIDFVESEGINA